MSEYRCPECLAPVSENPRFLRCTQCAREYPIRDGVPLFSRNQDFYYGHEVSREVMRSILTRSLEIGWKRALTEHADSCGNMDFYNYSASNARAGFKFLLDHFGDGVVLDFGCGSGANTLSLARNFAHVYATDLTPERAQFTYLRAQQEQLSNVTVFCSGDASHVPLPDALADVIILDGVLEWVPESRPGHPSRVQIDFLKELGRVLKPSGHFFITIENRFGAGYFAGVREEHTRMRFVSLLPRKAGDLYSQLLRGRPVRTYTYNRSGYRSILGAAGFDAVDFWGLLPSYRLMDKAFALNDRGMIQDALNEVSWSKRLRNKLVRPILPWVVGSFGIVAGKRSAVPYIADLVQYVNRTWLPGENLRISRYWQTPAGVVQVHAAGSNKRYILELPLHQAAEQNLDAAVKNIHELQSIDGVSLKELRVQTPIAWERHRGQAFFLQEELPGRDMQPRISPRAFEHLLPRASEYLVMLASKTRQPSDSWAELLSRRVREYGRPLVHQCRERGLSGDIEKDIAKMADLIGQTASVERGFLCAIHGDFRHSNLLVSADESDITAALNWGFFERQGLPFLDLFHFLLGRGRRGSWGERVVNLYQSLRIGAADTQVVRDYAWQIDVDQSLIPHFLVGYWLRQGLLRIRPEVSQLSKVLQEGISEPLEYFRTAALA